MNLKRWLFVILCCAFFAASSHSVDCAQDVKLDGVAGYAKGRAQATFADELSKLGGKWFSEALEEVLKDSETLKHFDLDKKIKKAVEKAIKKKIKSWLEEKIEAFIEGDIFGCDLGGGGCEEGEAIAGHAVSELDLKLAGKLDAIAGFLYDSSISELKKLSKSAGVAEWVNITDIKGSIHKMSSFKWIGEKFQDEMADVMGEATVLGIRRRIDDAFGGRLPPEIVDIIEKGPNEFDKYAKKAEKYLPGKKFDDFKKSILGRPLIKLPTPAYAAMLAGSAASHFSRAYKGVFIDAYELKRGIEVSRVMIWQVTNKEAINLSVMQLSNLSGDIAELVGIGETFNFTIDRLKEPLTKLEKKLDEIDKLLKKPIKDARKKMRKIVDETERELISIQEMFVAPPRDAAKRIDSKLKKAGDAIEDIIPEKINGIPSTWKKFKKRTGVNFDGMKIFGPGAEISDAENVPARNESLSGDLDPVLLHSGEFVQGVTDVVIPGRGIDFRFTRVYRGRGNFLGELGWKWTHSYAMRLIPWNDGESDGFTYIDENGRKFFFRKDGDHFVPPPGIYATISENDDGGRDLIERNGDVTTFGGNGLPLRMCDKHGNCIKLIYGETGLLSTIVDAFGRKIEIGRREDGLITALKDFAGRTFKYEYNDENELIGVITPKTPDFPKGKTTAYRYSDLHLMAMIIDPKGKTYLKNRYDDDGRVVAQSYGDGPWMSAVYEDGRMAKIGLRATSDPPAGRAGERRATEVKSRAWVTDEKGAVKLYEHNEEGHLLRLWQLNGSEYELKIMHGYNGDGERVATYYPSGRRILYFYGAGEGRGELLRIEDYPAGGEPKIFSKVEDNSRYNAFGQIVEEENGNGAVVRYEYYPANDPDGDGVKVKNAENDEQAAGGYLKSIEKGGEKIKFEYDPIGNIVSESDDGGKMLKFSVNALNQITREESNGGDRMAYGFDANDNLARAEFKTGGEKGVYEYEYGDLDRAISRRETVPETNKKYNDRGMLVELTDENGGVTRFAYDDLNRLISEKYPDGSEKRFSYNENGDVTEFVNRDSRAMKMEYDDAGRLISRKIPGANGAADVPLQSFEYDKEGRLVKAVDFGDPLDASDDVTTSFTYDSLSRPIAEDSNAGRLIRKYDDEDRVVALELPSGEKFYYEYDLNSRPVSVLSKNGQLAFYEYDSKGRFAKADFKNGFTLDVGYNFEGAISTMNYSKNAGVMLAAWETHYENGRVSRENVFAGVKRIFMRDDEARLVGALDEEGGCDEEPKILREWKYKPGVVEKKINFDANGAFVSDGKREFRYDAFGRLKSVWKDGREIVKYYYDAFDRRVAKKINGETQTAVWDGWHLVQESDSHGDLNYAYGHLPFSPFAVTQNGETTYLMSDRLWSVRGAVENGEKVSARCDYNPTGAEIEVLLPGWTDEITRELLPYDRTGAHKACDEMKHPFRFAGQIYDSETGLIYMRERYYDPNSGRFITPDPLDYKVPLRRTEKIIEAPALSYHRGQGGASRATFPNRPLGASPDYGAFPFNRILPREFNKISYGELDLYSYARNDPSTFVDPFGLASLLFDKSEMRLTLFDGKGRKISDYSAANIVDRKNMREKNPAGDPFMINGGGPFPNGTYSIGIPEFYSEEYRIRFYKRFGLGHFVPGEVAVTGPDWDGERRTDYSISQGNIRIRAGADVSGDNLIVWDRELFIHGGRDNSYTHATLGCIRARDDELETLAANFIEFGRKGDDVTEITVQE